MLNPALRACAPTLPFALATTALAQEGRYDLRLAQNKESGL